MIIFHCFLEISVDVGEFDGLFWSCSCELDDALDVGNGEGAIDEGTMRERSSSCNNLILVVSALDCSCLSFWWHR